MENLKNYRNSMRKQRGVSLGALNKNNGYKT